MFANTTNMNKYIGREDDLQIAAIRLIRMKHPDVLCIHVPNGGKRNAREGAKFKKMGVVAGVPDVLIFNPNGKFNGLAIELKTSIGKLTDSQREMHNRLRKLKWCVWVCYSIDDVENAIDGYFVDPKFFDKLTELRAQTI